MAERDGRVRELDGIRGVAVLLVLLNHAVPRFVKGGWLGVDVFFVLSGYLITGLLLAEHERHGRIALGAFYARRALRLLPALVLVLSVYALLALSRGWPAPDAVAWNVGSALFFVANWSRASGVHLDALGHTWSLSVEEQFYLVWPFAFRALARFPRRRVAVGLLALAVALGVHRGLVFHFTGSMDRAYNGSDTRADELIFGCAAAFLTRGERAPGPRWAWAVLSVWAVAFAALAVLLPVDDPRPYHGGLTLVASATAWAVARLDAPRTAPIRGLLSVGPLVWVGKVSYGLYLWHYLVIARAPWPAEWRGLERLLPNMGLAFACAAASYYLLERPFLRLKKRFERGALSPVEPAPVLESST